MDFAIALTDAVKTRCSAVALRDFLAQRRGLEHLDPRPHAHYPVRQLRRAPDRHRHDRRTVAATRETLAAMNRARTDVRFGLFAVNLQFDPGLGAFDNSESPFAVRRRVEAARIDEPRRAPVGLTDEFDRADSLHREIDDCADSMAVTENVKTAAVGDQRVWIEVVLPALAGQTGVVDFEPNLIQQRSQNYVELFAELTVVLGRVWDGVELALEVGQPRLLGKAQVLINLLPQPFHAFFQHRALQELEHGQREIQQRDLVRRRLRGFHRTDQPKFALAARAGNFNDRTAAPVEQIAAQHRHVTGKCALGNVQAFLDRPETPAVWFREQPGGDSCQP